MKATLAWHADLSLKSYSLLTVLMVCCFLTCPNTSKPCDDICNVGKVPPVTQTLTGPALSTALAKACVTGGTLLSLQVSPPGLLIVFRLYRYAVPAGDESQNRQLIVQGRYTLMQYMACALVRTSCMLTQSAQIANLLSWISSS